jgi:toxin CptA
MTSAPAIGFEYRPSRWPGRVLQLITVLAVLAVWLSAIRTGLKIALTGAAVLSAARAISRFAHPTVMAAGWTREGGWSLHMATHEDVAATLVSFRALGHQAIWLHLKTSGQGAVSLLLAPDNSDVDIRRRLRMRLALAASSGAQTPRESRGTLSSERGPTV